MTHWDRILFALSRGETDEERYEQLLAAVVDHKIALEEVVRCLNHGRERSLISIDFIKQYLPQLPDAIAELTELHPRHASEAK